MRSMAKKVMLLDDLTGDVIEEELGGGTVEFSFDSKHYQIDLGLKNRQAFEKDMAKWIEAAEELEAPRRRGRPAGAKTTRKPSGSGRSKEELSNIREWAAKQDIEVSPRGRIPAEVLQAYDYAHAPSESPS